MPEPRDPDRRPEADRLPAGGRPGAGLPRARLPECRRRSWSPGSDRPRCARGSRHARELPGIGEVTERTILESLRGEEPVYLRRLEAVGATPLAEGAAELRAALRGDCHVHTEASDGGASIREMAESAHRARARLCRHHRPLAAADGGKRPVAGAPARPARGDRGIECRAEPVPPAHRDRGRHQRGRFARPGSGAARPPRRCGRQCPFSPALGGAGHDRAHGDRAREPEPGHPRPLHRPA